MDWPTAILLIVVIGAITSTIQAKIGARRAEQRPEQVAVGGGSRRVEEEVRGLKERIAVLERIAIDRNRLLEQQFEQLLDS